jgi:hypothetical protein
VRIEPYWLDVSYRLVCDSIFGLPESFHIYGESKDRVSERKGAAVWAQPAINRTARPGTQDCERCTHYARRRATKKAEADTRHREEVVATRLVLP